MSYPAIGQRLIILPSIDSTNNYAMGQANAGLAAHGTVYFALEQTAGKGQRGKNWIATVGENIMMSVVLQPQTLKTSDQFLLSTAIALGCYDFFKNYAGEETRIKWPNDIYWRDRKAVGILIENRIKSEHADRNGQVSPPVYTIDTLSSTPASSQQWVWAIAGMGININQTQFGESALRPVSLKQITGKTWDLTELTTFLCSCLERRYQQLAQPHSVLANYHDALYKINQPVKLKKANSVFETTIQGITPSGQLITKDVIERYFEVGEVEWVI